MTYRKLPTTKVNINEIRFNWQILYEMRRLPEVNTKYHFLNAARLYNA